jgi:GNAT superfamily N-acetyltransferase
MAAEGWTMYHLTDHIYVGALHEIFGKQVYIDINIMLRNNCDFIIGGAESEDEYVFADTFIHQSGKIDYIAVGHVIINSDTKHAKIYALCTDENHRNQGRMGKLVEAIITYIKEKGCLTAWLGVDLTNEYFDAAVSIYAKNGFTVTDIEVLESAKGDIHYVSMKADFTSKLPPVRNFQLKRANIIKKAYLEKIDTCKRTFNISLHVLNHIRKQLTYNRERGGIFEIVNVNDNQEFILGFNEAKYDDETNQPINTIPHHFVPGEYFHFHTHPVICYEQNNCKIGWPSGEDQKFILHAMVKDDLQAAFVFSLEGVYIVTPSLFTVNNYYNLYKSNDEKEAFRIIFSQMADRFDERREQCRVQHPYFVINPVDASNKFIDKNIPIIKDYIQWFSTITHGLIRDLMIKKDEDGDVIIESKVNDLDGMYTNAVTEIRFYPWKEIEASDGIKFSLLRDMTNQQCLFSKKKRTGHTELKMVNKGDAGKYRT